MDRIADCYPSVWFWLNSRDENHRIPQAKQSNGREVKSMRVEISAKLDLTKEEIAHIYHGGVISVKIRGKDADTSLEISCVDSLPSRGTRIRFKQIQAG